MPHSALIYRELAPSIVPARTTMVVLHGVHGGLDDLVPLARSLGPDVRIVAPEAARTLYRIREAVAHAWYGGWQVERPEPASFGDSLAQLERFLHDVRERAGAGEGDLPWLLGYDQGAVLALSLAAIAPDLIAGVIAIGGCLPIFTDKTLIEPVASSLPILIVGDPTAEHPPRDAIEATAGRFTDLGAQVMTVWLDDARGLGSNVADAVRDWLDERIA